MVSKKHNKVEGKKVTFPDSEFEDGDKWVDNQEPEDKGSTEEQPTLDDLISRGAIICGKCGRVMTKVKTDYECPGLCDLKTIIKGSDDGVQAAIPFDKEPEVPIVLVEQVAKYLSYRNGAVMSTVQLELLEKNKPDWWEECKTFIPEVVEFLKERYAESKTD